MVRSLILRCCFVAATLTLSAFIVSPPIQVPSPVPLGRLIDLGGYKLHLNCTGSGSPTVLLSSGGGSFSTDWALVQPEVAKFTRVCSYDRSGAAWSDLGPKPRTMYQEAFDLQRLLIGGGEHGPFVLVGQSLGGMVMRLFAMQHRRETAGIVFVDAYSEDAQLGINGKLTRARLTAKNRSIPPPRTTIEPSDELTPSELQHIQALIQQNGGTPKIYPPFDKLPPYAQGIRIWALTQPKYYAQDDDYLGEVSAKMYSETRTTKHALGSIPLTVLARTKYEYPPDVADMLTREHKEQQAKLSQLSTKGSEVIVPNAGHDIEVDAPEKVVDAIHSFVIHARR